MPPTNKKKKNERLENNTWNYKHPKKKYRWQAPWYWNRFPMQRQQTKFNKWKHIPKVLATQSCPTLCDPTDCSLPGSSVYGDSPDKNTGVGSIFYSRGYSRGDWTWVSCIAGRSFTIWATGKAHNTEVGCISFSRGSSWSRGSNPHLLSLLQWRQILYLWETKKAQS